jgi:RNA ligase
MFAQITHLDQMLRAIEHKSEFVHIQKDGYSVVDYVFVDSNTFESNLHLEGRGIKFDQNGKLIARPFHKFFNYGEKPHADANLDWSGNMTIMEKLDGSMIHPALINGELVFMTRKGVTDTALQAMEEVRYDKDEMVMMLKMGLTPIYEYVSPNNRVVVHYDRPHLIHLATRENVTGRYVARGESVIRENTFTGRDEILEYVKGLEGSEGFVIAFDDGHMIKIKADEYVLLHRNIDLAGSEKRVAELVLNDKVDDILPMLDEARKADLIRYQRQMNARILLVAKTADHYVRRCAHLSQKDFALSVNSEHVRKEIRPILFKVRAGAHPIEAVKKAFASMTKTNSDIEANRKFLRVDPLNTRPM